MLEEGPDMLTHARLSTRTGIGRNTLYRHWPEHERLLIDTLTFEDFPRPAQAQGSLESRIYQELGFLQALLSSPMAQIFVTVIHHAEQSEEIRDIKHNFARTGTSQLLAMLTEAQNQGLLSGDMDVSQAVESLVAPLFYRRFISNDKLPDDALSRQLVFTLFKLWSPAS